MIRLLILMMTLVVTLKAYASPQDVESEGNLYIKVVTKAELVTFSLCSKIKSLKDCQPLGRQAGYSLNELRTQREQEEKEFKISAAGNAAAAVAFIALGTYLGIKSTNMPGNTNSVGMAGSAGALTGFATYLCVVAPMLSLIIKKINPLEQYKEAQTLSEGVLTTKKLVISGGDYQIQEFATNLEVVLSRIN